MRASSWTVFSFLPVAGPFARKPRDGLWLWCLKRQHMKKFAQLADIAASATTELLEKADKKAGERIEKVKEQAGLPTQATPRKEEGLAVPVSSAAAALLGEAERDMWLRETGRPAPTTADGAIEADGAAAAGAQDAGEGVVPSAEAGEGDEMAAQRKARQAEWVALQQELQILTMHGKKLQARLTACAAQLAQARHTEQQLRRQLQEAEEGRRAAEEPLREAELRAKRAEEALG